METTFYVVYYPIGKAREVKTGFTSREQAWEWVKTILETIDCYFIRNYSKEVN